MAPRLKDLDLKKTKESLNQFLSQAKDSVKVLEALQKEGLSRANEQIVARLRKMGFATREDVRSLERKVEDLASELRAQISKLSRKPTTAGKKESDADAAP